MDRAETERRGKQRDIARLQTIDRLFVRVETDKPAFGGHIDLAAKLLLDVGVAGIETILEGVGHRDEFYGPILDP